MTNTTTKTNNHDSHRRPAHESTFLFSIIALATLLLFVLFFVFTERSERDQARACHASSLLASENAPENVNDVEYYEFLFKVCMREAGHAL
jgi:hypothetical protein